MPRIVKSGLNLLAVPGAIKYHSAATLGHLANNANVTNWPDLVSPNNPASISEGWPNFITNANAGRPAVKFNGTNNRLTYPHSIFSYTGAAHVACVVRVDAVGTSKYGSIISEQSGSNMSIGCLPYRFPNSAVDFTTDAYYPGGIATGARNLSQWYIVQFDWANWSTHKTGNGRIFIDGVNAGAAAYGSNPAGFSSTLRQIGAFDMQSPNGHAAITLAELFVAQQSLPDDIIRQIARQWGRQYNILTP